MSSQSSMTAASVPESFQQQMKRVAELQQQRTMPAATASARGNKVIATVFAEDIEGSGYIAIAAVVTESTQQAAYEITCRADAPVEPLRAARAHGPKLSDVLDGLSEFQMPKIEMVFSSR